MTEVFVVRERDGEQLTLPGTVDPEQDDLSGKPPIERARNRYLHVHQAAPNEISPYNIGRTRMKYGQLPPEPFEKGTVRVDSDPNPKPGWGVFRISPDGSLRFTKDSWDSSG